ncbi:hypothetical protein ABJI51_15475 [Amycolatopsis sp. NEAU-NG30]|uniref:Uncharacterized protein n=1 Tax=Amycolatopsis melonis TaxID=3156488 RepID=A0ABV0LDX0_9PSEU
MTSVVLVAKYDEAARNGEVDDWTSSDDIGAWFAGEVLTPAEYYRVEDRYVDFARSLVTSCGVTEFVIRAPMVPKSLPPWVPRLRSGLVVDSETALKLVRRMLRIGDFSCVLCGGDDLTIGVETDFYLSVQADEGKTAEAARRFGLYLYQAGNLSWFELDDGVAVLGKLSDRFAQDVRRFRGAGRSIVVLERWANGPGGERWHLFDGADSLGWTLRLPPGVALAALPDVRIKWVPRRDAVSDIGVELGDDKPVVVVARPQPDVGSVLEAVVFSGGVHQVEDADLPLGGELGWFAYPDIGGAARNSLAGVTATPAGEVDALWDVDLTLIR